jgi:hypothetical protein
MSVVVLLAGAIAPSQLDPVAQVVFVGADFQSTVAAWETGAGAQASTAALAIKPASRQPFNRLDSGGCEDSIPEEMIGETNAREVSTVFMEARGWEGGFVLGV